MNQLTHSPSNSPRQLSSTTPENHRAENNTTIFSPNGYSRNIENSMENNTPVRSLKKDEEFRPAVDIKSRDWTITSFSRNLTTMPFSNDISSILQEQPRPESLRAEQARERLERMRQRQEETKKMLDTHVAEISAAVDIFQESTQTYEQSLQRVEETMQRLHSTSQSVQVKILDTVFKINESCDEAKQKIDEALEKTEIQISSNELAGKEMVEELQNTQNNFDKIVANDILDPINFNLTVENTEINKTLTLIGTLD